MRDRGRGGEKKGTKCYVSDFVYEHREGVSFICVSRHSKYRKRHGNAMPAAKCAFIYLFIQIACNGRGRVDLNQSNLKLPILISFYIYTLVIFIKDDQWLVTTKPYWFATKYSLLSIWYYFLLTRELHYLQLKHLFYFTGIYPADIFSSFCYFNKQPMTSNRHFIFLIWIILPENSKSNHPLRIFWLHFLIKHTKPLSPNMFNI